MSEEFKGYRHSLRTRQILWVLAPIVCPPEIVERDLLEPTIDHMENFMRSLPGPIQGATLLGLNAFEVTAALHPAHGGRTFTQLDRAAAERWFELWWHSPLALMREFAKKTKGLVVMSYYELPQVAASMAYHPDRWIAAVAARRLERYGEEIRRKEAQVRQSDPLSAALVEGTGRAVAEEVSG